MHMRNFVLYPLVEICSDFKDPRNGKSIPTLINNSKDSVIPKKVEEEKVEVDIEEKGNADDGDDDDDSENRESKKPRCE